MGVSRTNRKWALAWVKKLKLTDFDRNCLEMLGVISVVSIDKLGLNRKWVLAYLKKMFVVFFVCNKYVCKPATLFFYKVFYI